GAPRDARAADRAVALPRAGHGHHPRPAGRRLHGPRALRRRRQAAAEPAGDPARSRTLLSVAGRASLRSRNSVLSIASEGSFCSIASVGSAFSIGSVGSVGSAFSVGSAGSVASALSAGSIGSVLSAGQRGAALGRPLQARERWLVALAA